MVVWSTAKALENLVAHNIKGKVISAAIYYIILPDDGGLWPWRKRVPSLQPGMTESKMDEFFNPMIEQQWDLMKDEPRVCKCLSPQATSAPGWVFC
jgi:hypothetical protein